MQILKFEKREYQEEKTLREEKIEKIKYEEKKILKEKDNEKKIFRK